MAKGDERKEESAEQMRCRIGRSAFALSKCFTGRVFHVAGLQDVRRRDPMRWQGTRSEAQGEEEGGWRRDQQRQGRLIARKKNKTKKYANTPALHSCLTTALALCAKGQMQAVAPALLDVYMPEWR